ncbi:hypothetical protein [Pseudomonas botevensis]|uniref:hypothetical protein n=1 Tax=Pseudomonas botevensis TaxID=2842352 RepID=UPI001C3E732F|nr:hypothetical protein [Pseudomonas botevensis]MBV4477633.1 hypothetical protein [Pseudomonas botevensis]
MAIVRENALQIALISVLIASERQGTDLAELVKRALSMTASYSGDSSGVVGVQTHACLELQAAYESVISTQQMKSA